MNKKYILIVEDEVLLYNNLKDFLEANNFETSGYIKTESVAKKALPKDCPI